MTTLSLRRCVNFGSSALQLSNRTRVFLPPDHLEALESFEHFSFVILMIFAPSLAQGDSLQEYDQKFEELPDEQKLTKLCKDAGWLKKIGKGQLFMTIEKESEVMQTACPEYTQPRYSKTSRPRGWVRSNTKKTAQSWM